MIGTLKQKQYTADFFSRTGGRAMGRVRKLFTYKCVKGHLMQLRFPLGTRFDEHDETTCPECLKTGAVMPAYLVWSEDKADEELNVGKHA